MSDRQRTIDEMQNHPDFPDAMAGVQAQRQLAAKGLTMALNDVAQIIKSVRHNNAADPKNADESLLRYWMAVERLIEDAPHYDADAHAEALSYGVRCDGCKEWETQCHCSP